MLTTEYNILSDVYIYIYSSVCTDLHYWDQFNFVTDLIKEKFQHWDIRGPNIALLCTSGYNGLCWYFTLHNTSLHTAILYSTLYFTHCLIKHYSFTIFYCTQHFFIHWTILNINNLKTARFKLLLYTLLLYPCEYFTH